jgi:opacity protein-like surface antigen
MNQMHRWLSRAALIAGAATLTGFPITSGAQLTVPSSGQPALPRFTVAADLIFVEPKGDLATYIGSGWGGNGTGLIRVEPQGVLHARFDIGMSRYGREHERIRTGGGTYDLNTNNVIEWFGFGPQIAVPGGPLRPYVNAGVGLTRFRTTSTLTDAFDDFEYGSVDHASDFTTGWMMGGGLYIPFRSRSPVSLNVGARYHFGGEAEYLNEGGIQDNPDGSVTLTTNRSKTDFVLWQLGLSFRLSSGPGGPGL